jgi:hypothetical protein
VKEVQASEDVGLMMMMMMNSALERPSTRVASPSIDEKFAPAVDFFGCTGMQWSGWVVHGSKSCALSVIIPQQNLRSHLQQGHAASSTCTAVHCEQNSVSNCRDEAPSPDQQPAKKNGGRLWRRAPRRRQQQKSTLLPHPALEK